ncbi:MAG: TolB-like 6-bladed beta-propeller domain-containing protein [Bacteroidales bacterium]|jgi:hypothetical protein|nr:TolB-like 6-bladed beta-propeller domain-containing protein [Bacteroidales bacterium]
MKKKLLLIFALIFNYICAYTSSNTYDFFANTKKISGEKVDIGCLIGTPSELVLIDSLLLFYDRYERQTITVFDTKNNRFIRRFLYEGNGPEEIIPPLKLFVSYRNKQINIFQIQTGSLYVYDAKDIAVTEKEPAIYQKLSFGDRPANIKQTRDGFVGIGMFNNGRFHLYDQEGKFVNPAGQYPFRGEEMNPDVRFFVYQGVFCSSPNGNSYAIGSSYCDNLEFYHIENNNASLVKKYETYDVNAKFEQKLIINEECIMNYKAAYGCDKYCYMLYSGKPYLENGKRSYSGKKIIVFDWKGEYVKSFEADKEIFAFCVDENEGVIYAFTYDEEEGNIITRFKI